MDRMVDSSTTSSSRFVFNSKIGLQRVLNKNASTNDLTCKICDHILPIKEGEVCSTCGEQFCSDCVDEKIKKDGENRCIFCDAEYRPGTVPRIVKNLLKDLKIICLNCNQSFC